MNNMNNIIEQLTQVKGQITQNFFDTYGVDDEAVNRELSQFIEKIIDESLSPIINNLKDISEKNSLIRIESKLDLLLENKTSNKEVTTNNIIIKTNSDWGRYQRAYYKWIASLGIEITKHAGERSKLCSQAYKEFKKKSDREKEEFLNEWS